MGDISSTLLSHYGLYGVKATKERGYFVCKTEHDFFKLHKTTERHQAIWLQYELLNKLEEQNFPRTDKILISTHGTPFVQLGRETYIMSRYIKGREPDLNCPQDVTQLVETLARFHLSARGIELNKYPTTALPLTETFAKNSAFLTKTSRQASKNSRLSDFDVMFIKNIPRYIEYGLQSVELLAQTDYNMLYAQALAEGHICHNELKEENLPILDEVCYMANWGEATVDAQITDFVSFLRRYARRSNRQIPLKKLLETYDNVCPLPKMGAEIIFAQLVHPWQFMKIVQQYYSKKRGWTPIAIMSRMVDVLEEQVGYDAYINA